jgi:hypothetical protein
MVKLERERAKIEQRTERNEARSSSRRGEGAKWLLLSSFMQADGGQIEGKGPKHVTFGGIASSDGVSGKELEVNRIATPRLLPAIAVVAMSSPLSAEDGDVRRTLYCPCNVLLCAFI